MGTVSHLKRDGGRASRPVHLALNELLKESADAPQPPAHHLPEQIRNLCKRVRPLELLWDEELALRDEENLSAVNVLLLTSVVHAHYCDN